MTNMTVLYLWFSTRVISLGCSLASLFAHSRLYSFIAFLSVPRVLTLTLPLFHWIVLNCWVSLTYFWSPVDINIYFILWRTGLACIIKIKSCSEKSTNADKAMYLFHGVDNNKAIAEFLCCNFQDRYVKEQTIKLILHWDLIDLFIWQWNGTQDHTEICQHTCLLQSLI